MIISRLPINFWAWISICESVSQGTWPKTWVLLYHWIRGCGECTGNIQKISELVVLDSLLKRILTELWGLSLGCPSEEQHMGHPRQPHHSIVLLQFPPVLKFGSPLSSSSQWHHRYLHWELVLFQKPCKNISLTVYRDSLAEELRVPRVRWLTECQLLHWLLDGSSDLAFLSLFPHKISLSFLCLIE